jgi:isopenicillin N synthase-like dioxygenase
MDRIPSIDLTPFLSGSDRQQVVREVCNACETLGFLVVSGHSLPRNLLERAFAEAGVFFDLPHQNKLRVAPPVKGRQRGYHGLASRNLGKTLGLDVPPDLRESLFLGPIEDHRSYYVGFPEAYESYAPNVLPDEPAGFSDTVQELYRDFEHLSTDLLRIFALALELPEMWFTDKMTRHFSVMSVHHYPPLLEQPRPGQLRTGAHTDFGALTMLAMSGAAAGLEVLAADGDWLPVTAGPGELVINLGDMMARWTNNRWASTIHRVTNPPVENLAEIRRQSIGYFMHPNYDVPISCIPSCLAPDATPRFPDVTAGAYIRMKIEQSHKVTSGGTDATSS